MTGVYRLRDTTGNIRKGETAAEPRSGGKMLAWQKTGAVSDH